MTSVRLTLGCPAGFVLAVLAAFLAQPGVAQQFQVWPALRDTSGPTIEIETEDNVRCRYTQGARPSFSVAGLSANPNTPSQNGGSFASSSQASQLGGGLLLTIPFGGNSIEGCGRLSALQEQRSKLALGSALLEQGLITQEQFQQLGASIARDLGISFANPGSLALPTKPVYEPPPPLNLAPASSRKPLGRSGTIPSGSGPAGSAILSQPRFPPVDTGRLGDSGTGTPSDQPQGANGLVPGASRDAGRGRPPR